MRAGEESCCRARPPLASRVSGWRPIKRGRFGLRNTPPHAHLRTPWNVDRTPINTCVLHAHSFVWIPWCFGLRTNSWNCKGRLRLRGGIQKQSVAICIYTELLENIGVTRWRSEKFRPTAFPPPEIPGIINNLNKNNCHAHSSERWREKAGNTFIILFI